MWEGGKHTLALSSGSIAKSHNDSRRFKMEKPPPGSLHVEQKIQKIVEVCV